jgi:hypothetical protein
VTKYRAKPVTIDGIRFASQAEARRYGHLKIMQGIGHIEGLVVHPRFPISVNGKKVCVYEADFEYRVGANRVIEDVKGVATPVYRLKKKLLSALYGIEITEVAA